MATGTINKPTTTNIIQATGSSNTETSTGGTGIVQITLSTTSFNTGSFSVSGGGIVVPSTGIYKVSASVYFHLTSTSTIMTGVFIKEGTAFSSATEIAATNVLADSSRAAFPSVTIAPVLVNLTAGNKVYLGCRTSGATGSYYSGNKATFLQIELIR